MKWLGKGMKSEFGFTNKSTMPMIVPVKALINRFRVEVVWKKMK